MFLFKRAASRRHGLLLTQPIDDHGRCQQCDGACCRAFTTVTLSWDEYERLRALPAHRLHLPLWGPPQLIIDAGCEFLVNSRCSIYADRPELCAASSVPIRPLPSPPLLLFLATIDKCPAPEIKVAHA